MNKDDAVRRPAALKFTIDHILNTESDVNRPNSQLSPESSFSSSHKPGNLNTLLLKTGWNVLCFKVNINLFLHSQQVKLLTVTLSLLWEIFCTCFSTGVLKGSTDRRS